MINKTLVKKYIGIVRELKSDFIFYDSHTHPFEVIFDHIVYHADKTKPGLFTRNGCDYFSPQLANLVITKKNSTIKTEAVNQLLQSRISQMFVQKIYNHTGYLVFNENMGLSGIDKSLLLPVAPASGSIENQMMSMFKLYGSKKEFETGTSIPNSVQNTEIYTFINKMIDHYGIKAVKIHPNITEINIGSNSGKQRLEAILSACGDLGIPVIIHGGKSRVLKNPVSSEYGCIDNLKNINWSLCKAGVVIAHAGGHSCTASEMESNIIPVLKKMLSSHDRLMVDIAALDMDVLDIVFRHIETDRILFGSDALYEQQWASVVKIWHLLTNLFSRVEEKFIQIASINPSRHIFKGEEKC